LEEVVPKITRQGGSDVGQSREVELDLAVHVCRRCKNSLPVLSCIDKRTKEGCDRGSLVGTVHSGQGGKGLVG